MNEDRLIVERQGEVIKGRTTGVNRAQLRRFNRGEIEPAIELDLHGLNRQDASEEVHKLIQDSFAQGTRCVSVIHGRGLRSSSGPVLKEAFIKWITEGAFSHLILAVQSAPAEAGGTGATWILIRRRR